MKVQKLLAIIVPLIFGAATMRAQDHPPQVRATKSRAARASRLPAPLLLFGAIPVSTHSQEARKADRICAGQLRRRPGGPVHHPGQESRRSGS